MLIDTLRIGGAAYLAWLGVQSLVRLWPRAGRPMPTLEARLGASRRSRPSFLEGLGVNILNPAIISFYLAVVPTFIPLGAPRLYFSLLAATHVGLAFLCHSGWATAFHVLRRVFARPAVRVTLELGTAAAMLWLAARVLGRM